jgi:hypothetical protein
LPSLPQASALSINPSVTTQGEHHVHCSHRRIGKRRFRLGTDRLISTEKGSSISFEDYAVALVDEIEKPAHRRQRFTVGY